ncbi:MAG: hypothetical protein ACOH2M_01085 [Cypionkella sp.]
MKQLALSVLFALTLAPAAMAFSIDLTMPNLTFPTAAPVVVSQACTQPANMHLGCK